MFDFDQMKENILARGLFSQGIATTCTVHN